MIEKHQVDNGNFIIPSGAQYPDWVIDRINHFQKAIYKINKENRDLTDDVQKQIVVALETFILPQGIKITKPLTKPEINNLVQTLGKVCLDNEFPMYIWLLMNAGFYLSTILPTCIDEDSLTVPAHIQEKRILINKEFQKTGNKQKYLEEIQSLSKEVLEYMTSIDNAFGDFLNSKANGTLDHIQELLVGVGLALNAKGEIIDTVTNCLVDGVSQTEYFSKGSTGIAALFAKSSETAKPRISWQKAFEYLRESQISNNFGLCYAA